RQRLFHSRAVSPLIDLPRRYRHRHVTKTEPARHAFAGLSPVLSWCRTDSVPLVRFSTLSHRWYMERSTRMRLKMKTSLQNLFKHKHALVALAVVLAPTLAHAQTQSGTLDASFGAGGKVTTTFAGSSGAGTIVVQPDGKLVAAGAAVVN